MKGASNLRPLLVMAGVLVLTLGLAASLSRMVVGRDEGSALSVWPEGRRAAFELLQRSGHRVLSWRQAPLALAEVDALLVVGEEAWEAMREVEDDDGRHWTEETAQGSRAELDPRSGAHYRRFLEEGGRAVVDVRAAPWLSTIAGVEISKGRRPSPPEGRPLRTPAQELLDANLASAAGLPLAVDGDPGVPLLEGPGGEPFAALYPVGAGSVLFVGDTDLWRNDRIGEGDHAFLLLALVGLAGGDRVVLFDEFARGVYDPPGFVTLAFTGRVAPFGWSLLLWGALVVTASVWTWRFPRDPRARDEVHPFLRVRAAARLLDRARPPADVARRLRAGVLRGLARRLRLEADDDAVVASTVQRAPDETAAERWTGALAGSLPQDQRALEVWARELTEIERAVEASFRRETHEGAGRTPRAKHG